MLQNINEQLPKLHLSVKVIITLIIITIAFNLLNPLIVIDAWNKWVVFSKFGWVKQETLWEWIHLRIPLIESIVQMNVRTQKILFTNNPEKYPDISNIRSRLDSASSDLQDVFVDTIVTFSLSKDHVSRVYQDVGLDYKSKKVVPLIINSIKTHTAKYKVAEILTNREKIKNAVEKELTAEFLKEWIIFEWVSLSDFNFNAEFKKSIEEKQIAEQRMEKEKYELERIAIQAQQKVKEAEADSEAQIKRAEWEKQAKILQWEGIETYNKLIKLELSQWVLDYKKLEIQLQAIDKWKWDYPTYYMWGEGWAIPLINIWSK
jgi:regulator of protease activity HflC (stomatin/prohibitin superfamily)